MLMQKSTMTMFLLQKIEANLYIHIHSWGFWNHLPRIWYFGKTGRVNGDALTVFVLIVLHPWHVAV